MDSIARPKSNIERKTLSTTLKIELIDKLKKNSDEKGIPINRLIELSLEKYLDDIEIK